VLAVVGGQLLGGAGLVAAAVDPEHHRPLLAVVERRREDIDPQTVLADVVVVPMIPE